MTSSLKSVTLEEKNQGGFLQKEKEEALKALAEESYFLPVGAVTPPPYTLALRIEDGRLVMDMRGADDVALPSLVLSIKPYTRLVRDYFMLIESYEATRQSGTPCQLEAVDMGRRGLHNEGADLLIERLEGKITLDHDTARRLFTLICVLHGHHFPLF